MKKATVLCLMIALQLLTLTPSAAHDDVRWWNDRVFYEIFVRSFYDSDGDGIGDLQGIIQKLDYLNDGDPTTTTDLGVTGLWLMPIAESPSYHGYDVTDYLMVEPDYGTDDDFKALMAAAHERGIAVIVDLVVNHSSREHPWFQASAAGNPHYADWYIWDDDCPTYRGPWGEQVWIPLNDSCYYAIFWEGMPDLNYTNPAVTSAIENVAHYWLQDMGVDGFRVDALQHIVENGQNQANTDATHEWANAFQSYIKSVDAGALTVGEVNASSYLAAPYVPEAADLVFAFDLADAMVQSANVGKSAAVMSLQNRAVDLYPPNQYAAFLTNHDQNRVMNTLRGSVDKAKVAATLVLTQPGVPFIYYGEEIGMSGIKPDERIRTPMQWDSTERTAGFTSGHPWQVLQNDIDTVNVNVAAQLDDPESLLSRYRDLIHLRAAHPALAHGDFVPVASNVSEVYSFLRRSDGETLLVVINLSGDVVTDYALSLDAGLPGAVVSSVYGAADPVQPVLSADGGFADYAPVPELAPYSLMVFALAE